jgi:hypothetical protein
VQNKDGKRGKQKQSARQLQNIVESFSNSSEFENKREIQRVYVCVSACVRACVSVCECVSERVSEWERERQNVDAVSLSSTPQMNPTWTPLALGRAE